jgi:hypothetical protein
MRRMFAGPCFAGLEAEALLFELNKLRKTHLRGLRGEVTAVMAFVRYPDVRLSQSAASILVRRPPETFGDPARHRRRAGS